MSEASELLFERASANLLHLFTGSDTGELMSVGESKLSSIFCTVDFTRLKASLFSVRQEDRNLFKEVLEHLLVFIVSRIRRLYAHLSGVTLNFL